MDLQKLHELQTAYEQQLRALESHFRYKKLEDERGDELERRRQEEIDQRRIMEEQRRRELER